jgi:hypothetical protein
MQSSCAMNSSGENLVCDLMRTVWPVLGIGPRVFAADRVRGNCEGPHTPQIVPRDRCQNEGPVPFLNV